MLAATCPAFALWLSHAPRAKKNLDDLDNHVRQSLSQLTDFETEMDMKRIDISAPECLI